MNFQQMLRYRAKDGGARFAAGIVLGMCVGKDISLVVLSPVPGHDLILTVVPTATAEDCTVGQDICMISLDSPQGWVVYKNRTTFDSDYCKLNHDWLLSAPSIEIDKLKKEAEALLQRNFTRALKDSYGEGKRSTTKQIGLASLDSLAVEDPLSALTTHTQDLLDLGLHSAQLTVDVVLKFTNSLDDKLAKLESLQPSQRAAMRQVMLDRFLRDILHPIRTVSEQAS